MKQENIIRNKMWDALNNQCNAIFPLEFYNKKELFENIPFDLKNVIVTVYIGKNNKGFDSYIFSFDKIFK